MYNIVLISPFFANLLPTHRHIVTATQPEQQGAGRQKGLRSIWKGSYTNSSYLCITIKIFPFTPIWQFTKKIICYKWQKNNSNNNNNTTTWNVLVHERPPNKPGHAAFGNKHQPFPPCSKNAKWRGPHSPHPPPAPPQVGIKALDTNWWLSNQSAWLSFLFLCKLRFRKEEMKLQFLLMVFKTTTRRFWKLVFNHGGKSRTHFLLLSRIGFD